MESFLNHHTNDHLVWLGVLNNCNSMIALDSQCGFLKQNSIVKVLPINWRFFTDNFKDFFTFEG